MTGHTFPEGETMAHVTDGPCECGAEPDEDGTVRHQPYDVEALKLKVDLGIVGEG